MEAIVGELQCPICLELLDHPVILPCAHVLCRSPCAERLFNSNFVRCPVCRDSAFVNGGVDSLPRVITLENIIDRYKNAVSDAAVQIAAELCGVADVACQLCEGIPFKAKKSCLDCHVSYCERCLRLSHPSREPFLRHVLVSPTRTDKPELPPEPKCKLHSLKVGIFCENCEELGCLLCADEQDGHRGHKILTLKEATEFYKTVLDKDLCYLTRSQGQVTEQTQEHQRTLQTIEDSCTGRRQQITEQCGTLISEISAKRELFLSDLEFEERSKKSSLLQQIQSNDEQSSTIQNLVVYNRESLSETQFSIFVQLAKCIHERTEKTLDDAKSTTRSSSPASTALHHKVLDLRKVRAIIRDITYLSVPSKPQIDIEKCSRSVHSVVLVLCTPDLQSDVIDEYRVYYATPQQQRQGLQSTMLFKTPGIERNLGRGPVTHNAVCLIHDDLQSDTMHSFSVRAYNAAGESELSEKVECSTLEESTTKLRVPVIVQSMCRSYSCAIQIHSPSPCDVTSSHVTFYLLYREADDNKIWKSISLCGRVDHRVFGLDADTMYDFVIMACDAQGECQVSNMVTLRTENAAV